ncbi:MAG: type IV secretion system DNA-binding domain-containing protein [Candidatus Saccharibacteria bacterium]|nr:type IV secretion system DNA-binding domain-containing protein [Candidatus Saccharibacteria bacterium]
MESAADYLATALRFGSIVLGLIVFAISAVILWLVIRFVLNRRYLRIRDMIWLEITPPATVAKTPEATEQLFSVIHGYRAARSFEEKLLDRSPVMSFEIISTKKHGVRYLVQIEQRHAANMQKAITSYIADSKVHVVKRKNGDNYQVIEFRETEHYVLPLATNSTLEQRDPLSYVIGAMARLNDDEEIILQLVATPTRLREAEILSHKILGNENILQYVSGKNLSFFGKLVSIFGRISSGATDLISEVHASMTTSHRNYYNSKTRLPRQQIKVPRDDRPARVLSAFELELMETMHQKVTRPLFRVNLRVMVNSPEPKRHIAALKSALDGFSAPPYQSLKAKYRLPILDNLLTRAATKRLPSLQKNGSIILASSELASLFHFPSSYNSKTDNLITSLSRTLPAPISLKQSENFDVIIGENHHHNTVTPIGLTEAERERHQYIIGGTGSGKTTMLQYQIVQDICSGKGVAVIDPHGDMAETILRHVPPKRLGDVIYFNPDDLDYPVGLNLLELTPGLSGSELMREKDLITESVVSIFRKIFSDEDSGGHRIEYILRNTIQTALTQESPTIFTVFDLLNDPKYRRSVVKNLDDTNLTNFWKNEFGKAGDMQKVKMSAGITAKIGRFLFSASARQILEQPKSTIDFDDIINSGKILICNLSKGLLGEDTSELFGITILAKLQLASLRRARLKQAERRTFYLYVDEFQNFATTSFVQMLSESRKYRVFMIMAEQSTSQQSDQQTVNIILANVGTIICFRTGNPQDEQRLLPMLSPYIEPGEISNLPAYNYYARLAAVHAQEPLSGQTLLLKNEGDETVQDEIVKHSRKEFAKKREEIYERKSSGRTVSKKATRTNKSTKKKTQAEAQSR